LCGILPARVPAIVRSDPHGVLIGQTRRLRCTTTHRADTGNRGVNDPERVPGRQREPSDGVVHATIPLPSTRGAGLPMPSVFEVGAGASQLEVSTVHGTDVLIQRRQLLERVERDLRMRASADWRMCRASDGDAIITFRTVAA